MALNAEQEGTTRREDDVKTGTAYLLHNLLLKQRNLRVHPRNVNVNLRTEHKKYLAGTVQTSTCTIRHLPTMKWPPSHVLWPITCIRSTPVCSCNGFTLTNETCL